MCNHTEKVLVQDLQKLSGNNLSKLVSLITVMAIPKFFVEIQPIKLIY